MCWVYLKKVFVLLWGVTSQSRALHTAHWCSEVSVRPLSYPGAPEGYELVLVAYERYLFIQIDLDLKSISKIFPFLQTDSSAYLKPNKLSQLFTNRIFFWDKIYSNFKFCFLFGRKRLKRKLTIDWLTCRSLIIFLK